MILLTVQNTNILLHIVIDFDFNTVGGGNDVGQLSGAIPSNIGELATKLVKFDM